jgi:hypothetical protein
MHASIAWAKTQTWDIALDKHWLPFLKETWEGMHKDKTRQKPKLLKPKITKIKPMK